MVRRRDRSSGALLLFHTLLEGGNIKAAVTIIGDILRHLPPCIAHTVGQDWLLSMVG